jgi:hypothetical protein
LNTSPGRKRRRRCSYTSGPEKTHPGLLLFRGGHDGETISEKALVILERKEAFERTELSPLNPPRSGTARVQRTTKRFRLNKEALRLLPVFFLRRWT